MYLIAARLLGVVAGLRSMTAPAAVSWGARAGRLHLEGTPFGFFHSTVAFWILAIAAIGEILNDKAPWTPSRKAPPSFVFRVVSGAVSGAAAGASGGSMIGGLLAGGVGAVVGTLGGHRARAAMARAFGRDLPAALLEDAVAVGGALSIVWLMA